MGKEHEPRGADNKRIEEHLGELETHSPPVGGDQALVTDPTTEERYRPWYWPEGMDIKLHEELINDLIESAEEEQISLELSLERLDDVLRNCEHQSDPNVHERPDAPGEP